MAAGRPLEVRPPTRAAPAARVRLAVACKLALALLHTAEGQDIFLARSSAAAQPASRACESDAIRVRLGAVESSSPGPVSGRVRVYLQRHNDSLPVNGNSDGQDTNQVFGVDASAWEVGASIGIGKDTLGYPVASLRDLPAGTYYAQAELFHYTLFNRTGLPPTWLPTSCVSAGGQNGEYAKPDGTLFSSVATLSVLPASKDGSACLAGAGTTLTLDRAQPPASSPGCAGLGDGVDSDYIKTFRLKSELLSQWWGTPITLEACVLLPFGWDQPEHADARYPLVVAHGHYSPQWSAGGTFRTEEPTCDPAEKGYSCVNDWYAWYLYKNWTSTDAKLPFTGARMLIITINHPVPFFDDSYAVDSANMGPYGSAIMRELIPAVESKFRGIGAGWARGAMGGSTGGWESFAMPVLFPDDFNAAFAACPDPVTFSKYTTIDIYRQSNAYYYDSAFKRTHLPGYRDGYSGTTWPGSVTPYGEVIATVEEQNHRELVLGEHSRSCGQWDIWEAVFSPACPDGFPCRIYDKLTGQINHTVAEYWRDHFDLAHIVRRDWATLGPKLNGSLHVFVGGSDSFYLSNAVMDAQDLIEGIDPSRPTGIEWVIGNHHGRGFQHCFRGYEYDSEGNPLPNSITRLTYAQAFLPRMAARFAATAPEGADVTSWRY